MADSENLAQLMDSLSLKGGGGSLGANGGIKKKNIRAQYIIQIGQTTCKSEIPLSILLKMRKYKIDLAKYRE